MLTKSLRIAQTLSAHLLSEMAVALHQVSVLAEQSAIANARAQRRKDGNAAGARCCDDPRRDAWHFGLSREARTVTIGTRSDAVSGSADERSDVSEHVLNKSQNE